MKKLVLQHWTGDLNELATLSSANISRYAAEVGADYELVRGQFFRKHLTTPCQKVGMILPRFDTHDAVVMVDCDMFVPAKPVQDIFAETGIAIDGSGAQRRLRGMGCPTMSMEFPFYGGAIYRMDKPLRQRLREYLDAQNEKEMLWYSPDLNHSYDEGIVSRLCERAGVGRQPGRFLADKWAWGSFQEDPLKNAAIVHIRGKISIALGQQRRTKMENYRAMVEQGVIAE